MKINEITAIFTACILAFTLYISLDTFVISNAYQEEATEINSQLFQDEKESKDVDSSTEDVSSVEADGTEEVSETENNSSAQEADYEDENIRITMTEYNMNETAIYVADIELSSAEYLKTAFAEGTYGKNIKATT